MLDLLAGLGALTLSFLARLGLAAQVLVEGQPFR